MVAVCDRYRTWPVGRHRSGFLRRSSGLSLIGAPWIVTGLLAVLGIIVLVMALQVHKYANTDPKKRPHSFINPTIAVYTLVLAKALGLAGAGLAGWYGGQILMSIGHIERSIIPRPSPNARLLPLCASPI